MYTTVAVQRCSHAQTNFDAPHQAILGVACCDEDNEQTRLVHTCFYSCGFVKRFNYSCWMAHKAQIQGDVHAIPGLTKWFQTTPTSLWPVEAMERWESKPGRGLDTFFWKQVSPRLVALSHLQLVLTVVSPISTQHLIIYNQPGQTKIRQVLLMIRGNYKLHNRKNIKPTRSMPSLKSGIRKW